MSEKTPPPNNDHLEETGDQYSPEEQQILDARGPVETSFDPMGDAKKDMTRRAAVGALLGAAAAGVIAGTAKIFEKEKATAEWLAAQMNAVAAAEEARSFVKLASAAEAISRRALSETEENKVYGAVASVLKNLIEARMSEIGRQSIESPEQRTAYISALSALVRDASSVENHVSSRHRSDPDIMRRRTTDMVTTMVGNVLKSRGPVLEDIRRMRAFEGEINAIPTGLLWNMAGQEDLLRMVRGAKTERFKQHVQGTLSRLQVSTNFEYTKNLDIFRRVRAQLENDLNELVASFDPIDFRDLQHSLSTMVLNEAARYGVDRL